jgi:hypothetical protein
MRHWHTLAISNDSDDDQLAARYSMVYKKVYTKLL